MIRRKIETALEQAEQTGDAERTALLRLVLTALADRDAGRAAEDAGALTDEDVMQLLERMVRQRQASVSTYERAGKMELAEQERREIAILREFLPRPLKDADIDREIDRAIRETGARSIRDIGRVISLLKRRFPGRMDVARTAAKVRRALG